MSAPMKTCSKCATPKPLAEFYKDKRAADGLKCQCKACHVAGCAVSVKKNPEGRRVIQGRYDSANRSARRAASKAWKERHPERCRKLHENWKREHPERYKALMVAPRKRWKAANPEAALKHTHRRRARLQGANGSYTAEEIAELYAEQSGCCANAYCGRPLLAGFHRDHMTPIRRGGSNFIENIQLLCPQCNTRKSIKTAAEFVATERERAGA